MSANIKKPLTREGSLNRFCKHTDKSKTLSSLINIAMPGLALKAGQGLSDMYFNYYHRPTQMTHASAESVMARLREDEEGNLLFDNEGQRRVVKEAITAAHHLFLHVLALQNEYFHLGFDNELEKLGKDYRDCWVPNEPDPEPASENGGA